MVFYRKYRPQTIEELDSTSVRETFTAILSKAKKENWESLPHAFLFTGPKGLGKTSTARILAKAINCEHKGAGKETYEPCNICDQCVSITQGTSLDVLEIDAASNRGIDEIRDLKEKINLAPISAQKKVYIIDEVHMLTTEAFNALLKTLEEPPSHAVFILCTTEPQKVPATILSRCFHVTFQPATVTELVRSFRRIATAEKITVDDETLSQIAHMADGGFRDGVKILEEAVSYGVDGKNTITQELLESHFKYRSMQEYLLQMISLFEKKDVKKSLTLISTIAEQGISIREFVMQLGNTLHALLLEKVGVGEKGTAGKDTILSLGEITLLLENLGQVQQDMKHAVLPQLPLELMILEYCSEAPIEIIIEEKKTSDKKTEGVTSAHLRKQVGEIVKVKAMYGSPKETTEEKTPVKTNGVSLMHLDENSMPTKEWIDEFWRCIIENMKLHNHTIAGVLRGCMAKSFDKKILIIETAYKFHKEKLDSATVRSVLEEVCKELTGKSIEVAIQLKA